MPYAVRLCLLGAIDYGDAWRWQRQTADALRGGGNEALTLLQHPPVYTLGRRARPEHLLLTADELRARGAGVVEVDRGGDVTFHGPGQLVAYPVLDLLRRGLGPVEYVRALEQVLIDALAVFGIAGGRVPGRPGVWAGGAKIAAIGVRVQGGVTTHGFALNVSTDLAWFDAIVPCGLTDATVTSMEALLGRAPAMSAVERAVLEAFAAVFDARLRRAGACFGAPLEGGTSRPAGPRAGISGPGGPAGPDVRPSQVRPHVRRDAGRRPAASSRAAPAGPIISHGR